MPTVHDVLLASALPLPTAPAVVYARFVPTSPGTSSDTIELARRHVLAKNAASVLLESLLPSVQIGPPSAIYVFRITAHDHIAAATSTLTSLRLDGLSATEITAFSLDGLYPCSPSCALLSQPCPNCPGAPSPSTPASLLPRKPLRLIYSHFLDAVRIRLVDDIVKASLHRPSHSPVTRLKGGFLLGPAASTTHWGESWAYRILLKPLLYCHLQIHLSRNPRPSLIIHPQLLPTHFLPLAYTLPLPSGTPITLLPHETPAFFLTHYSGPTSTLTQQFRNSLQGLGVCGWDCSTQSNEPSSSPQFIIAWINVENKQGEDKGLLVIYPTALCLSFIPSPSAPSRPPIHSIPQLPVALQPSPQAPVTSSRTATPFDNVPLSTSAPTPIYLPDPLIFRSPSRTHYLRAFRSLTLSKANCLTAVATEVGSYVDAMARERERERERLKRERENGTSSSPNLSRSTIAVPPAAPAPVIPPSLTNNLLTTPLTGAGPNILTTPAQDFYPSPPQINTLNTPQTPAVDTALASSIPHPVATDNVQPHSSPTSTENPILHTSATIPTSASNSTSFDPFGTMDPSWTMQSQSYLGIDMDLDMDFDVGMGMGFDMNSGTRGGAAFRDTAMDFDDSAFTDDDFSFFDRPSASEPTRGMSTVLHTPIPPPENSIIGIKSGPSLGILPPSHGSIPLGLSPAAANTPAPSSVFPGDVNVSGPGPPPAQPQPIIPPTPSTSSPWALDSFTPRFASNPSDTSSPFGKPAFSAVLPPTPGPTPYSHSVPATPSISVHLDSDSMVVRRPSSGVGTFDPIPFAAYHRELDGKYAVGKFSLPSPPDEEDRTVPWSSTLSSSFTGSNSSLAPSYFPKSMGRDRSSFASIQDDGSDNSGWGQTYRAATDPRVGVVKKLIGVKRKMTAQGGREKIMSPSWVHEYEEWKQQELEAKRTKTKDLQKFSSNDDDDDVDSDLESTTSSAYSTATSSSSYTLTSRPSTPLPSYLPLGATLLHTHFQHAELLPLSTPLRPPGASVLPSTSGTVGTNDISVPTPVSPAAVLGANSEKSKLLEAAAAYVAIEVVENALWAEAWSVASRNGAGSRTSGKARRRRKASTTEVWLGDVKTVSQLLAAVEGVEGPLELETLFAIPGAPSPSTSPSTSKTANTPKHAPNTTTATGTTGVQMLEAPLIAVGKGDTIMQILPPAVRFWEKLGLGPKGGKKDGTIFVLFEDGGEQRLDQVGNWAQMVTATYRSKHFGTLVPGHSASCPRQGILPLRFDSSFRKALASLMTDLPTFSSNLVIFVVTPISMMSLASPALRQVFSAVQKALKTQPDTPVYFQFIPEHAIYGALGNPTAFVSDLDSLCISLYNRILAPVNRAMSRSFSPCDGRNKGNDKAKDKERVRKYFRDPLLTLARPLHAKVSFVRAAHASLGVTDRNTFLHVGYQVSPCGKWVLAACVDERGEAHNLGVWLVQTPTQGAGTPERDGSGSGEDVAVGSGEGEDIYAFVVRKVWEFAIEFARNADVEWRVVVAKLGSVDESELNAWAGFLAIALINRPGIPRLQVTLLSVEPDSSWTFCSTGSTPPKSPTSPMKTPRTGRSASFSKNQPQNIFTDITTTIYAIGPYTHLPQSLPPSLSDFGPAYIAEPSSQSVDTLNGTSSSLPHPLSLLPPSTTTLICIPASSPSPAAIRMLHIHLLHVCHSQIQHNRRSSSSPSEEELAVLHTEITRNFHDLAVLGGVQWRMGHADPLLPFHLAAVEAMRDALDVDWESGDVVGDGA